MLKKKEKVFDANMEFPEFESRLQDTGSEPANDYSEQVVSRLHEICSIYHPLQSEVNQLKAIHNTLPKEYRSIEIEKVPDFVTKLRTFSFPDTAPQFGRCAIIAVCFYFMFSSLMSALLILLVCFVVTVGVSFLTSRKDARYLENYYQEYQKLQQLCPDLSPLYGDDETLNRLLSLAKEKHPQSLEEAVSYIE